MIARSYFIVKPHDPQWKAWMAHLEAVDPDKAYNAQAVGELTAFGSRWPDTAWKYQVATPPRAFGEAS